MLRQLTFAYADYSRTFGRTSNRPPLHPSDQAHRWRSCSVCSRLYCGARTKPLVKRRPSSRDRSGSHGPQGGVRVLSPDKAPGRVAVLLEISQRRAPPGRAGNGSLRASLKPVYVRGDACRNGKTLERARKAKGESKAPTTQAGEFVREEMEHIRDGKHGARSTKQAIAIGLSKARRGAKLKPAEEGADVGPHTEERQPRVPCRSKRDAKEALSEAVAREIAGTQAGSPVPIIR